MANYLIGTQRLNNKTLYENTSVKLVDWQGLKRLNRICFVLRENIITKDFRLIKAFCHL